MTAYATHADLGGQAGHGRVVPEPEDLRFHEDWERSALALVLAMGATGSWNLDTSRAARETLPDYARLSYYQIWLAALASSSSPLRKAASAQARATTRAPLRGPMRVW